MSFPFDNVAIQTPFPSRSYLDKSDPLRPPRAVHGYTNDKSNKLASYVPYNVREVENIWLHAVHGDASDNVLPAESLQCQNETDAQVFARNFARVTGRIAAAHGIICDNGTVLCVADGARDRMYHIGGPNPSSYSIEYDQEGVRGICGGAVEAGVVFVLWLCDWYGVLPFFPARNGAALLKDSPRIMRDALTWRGIAFHANYPSRGEGDPGPGVGNSLVTHGLYQIDPDASLIPRRVYSAKTKTFIMRALTPDQAFVYTLQGELGFPETDRDGVWGKGSRARMKALGVKPSDLLAPEWGKRLLGR